MKQISEEIFYADQPTILINPEKIKILKNNALKSNRQRCRLCAHQEMSDLRHDMFIVNNRDTYVRPHKNFNKSSKSFHVIEGAMDVILFDEEGQVTNIFPMGNYQSGLNFFYRTSVRLYHTLLIQSDEIVFLESTNGPFKKTDTVYAPWAPEESNLQKAKEFMAFLYQKSDSFSKNNSYIIF